jgi:hypothetical protein
MPNSEVKFDVSDEALKGAADDFITQLEKSLKKDKMTPEIEDYLKKLRSAQDECAKRIAECDRVAPLERTINVKNRDYLEKFDAYDLAFKELNNLTTNQIKMKLTNVPPLTDQIKDSMLPETRKSFEESHAVAIKYKEQADRYFKVLFSHKKDINGAYNEMLLSAKAKKAEANQNPSHQPKSLSQPILSSSIEAKSRASEAKAADANRPASASGVITEEKKQQSKT